MPETLTEAPKLVEQISELSPGLTFEYEVRAEKGFFGDFPDKAREEYLKLGLNLLALANRLDRAKDCKHQFQIAGRWAVAATILNQVEGGHQALFNVFEDHQSKEQPLMIVRGTIADGQVIQEGLSTEINDFEIEGQEPTTSRQLLIPARPIHPGTLRAL